MDAYHRGRDAGEKMHAQGEVRRTQKAVEDAEKVTQQQTLAAADRDRYMAARLGVARAAGHSAGLLA